MHVARDPQTHICSELLAAVPKLILFVSAKDQHWCLHCCLAVKYWANKPNSCRQLLGGQSDAEQAVPTADVISVTRAGLAAKAKSAADIYADAQDGNDKQPLRATPVQNKSGARHTQPQAASGPTALAAMAAVQAASEHQDLSGPSAGVVDSPARKETAALKGSKNKEQCAKCAFC